MRVPNMTMRVALRGVVVFAVLASLWVLAQSTYRVVINNKDAKLETIEKNGKVFVEAQSFAKALGATASVDKTKKTVVVTSANNASATTPAQGTTQLTGGLGDLNKAYTLGKNTPLNFTLRGAEFTVRRQIIRENYVPKNNEKLLVLHFTVQNPQAKQDLGVSYSSLKITAVDDQGINHEFDSYFGREGSNEDYNVALKPAQKIDLYAVWPVPAGAKIPKLIVQRAGESDAPVVRYDMAGKIKGLAAPFVDPQDGTGAVALEVVGAQEKTMYPMGLMDVRLEGATYSQGPFEKRAPGEGKRFFAATFVVQNMSLRELAYSYASFNLALVDAEGTQIKFNDYLLRAARDEHADGTLAPKAETSFRVFFELPNEVNAKTLTINESAGPSRTYSFDVSKTP